MRTLLLVVLLCVAIWACGARATKKIKREPIILIPGFASSRLMAWKLKKCGSGFNINIGDRVWLDSSHVLYDSFREGCWSDCMMLNPHDQSDPPDCKLRPVSSIEAISELDPGQITGPLSSIFRNVIDLLSGEYDYDTTNLAAAPYDWRLPPNILEERDRYFSSLKATIEEMVHFNQKPAIIIAHSMGNNVFLYFTEWVKQQYPTNWQKWFDTHISSFFAVAPPLLGAPQTIRGALSGVTFGLPLSEAAVRNFMATYGSGPWMFPVPDPSPEIASRLQGGWPHDPVIVDYYTKLESKRYPIETITNGTLFSDAAQYDPKSGLMNAIQKKFYERQTINPLKEPPVRPPVKDIYCIYGINEKTELGYHYRVVDEAFRLKKKIFEDNGGEVYSTTSLLNRKEYISHSKWGKSGDGTVPYNSLSWCHTWHTGNVTLTETPTVVDTSSRLQGLQQLLGIEKLVYGRYKFDSISEENGRVLRTSVIELERQNHRDIIRSPNLIDVLKREIDPRTDIEYLPFEEVDIFPATVEDLKRHSMEDIKQMISILQRETEKREVLNSKKDKKDTSDSDNTEEIQEKIENDKSNQKMFIDEEAERDEHGRIILRGNNTEGLEEYLVDVRDDDEGSEFKTKAQGGIL